MSMFFNATFRKLGSGPWMTIVASLLSISLFCGDVSAQSAGQGKLEEATERKLNAESPADLAKVIELCEQAMELGLDEISDQMAKSMLAASALQRAQLMMQNLPRVVNNPNALRNLTAAMRADLEKAIASNPKLADAHILLARLETLPGGSRDRALSYMNLAIEALQDKPVNQAGAYVLRAGLQSSNADKLADLSKALALDPTNTDAWQAKIVLQLALGRVEEAARDAEKLLEDDESNKFAFQVAIEAFIELERLDDAYNLLSRRIEKDPQNGDNYRWRGRVAMALNKPEQGMQDLNEAIRLNPRDFEALMFRGQLFFTMDEVDKANRDISDSLLIQPESVQGVLLRSLISAREGRFADAIADMETLVRFNPTNQSWILQLASFYQLDQRPRLAIQVLDELLANDPKNWRALRTRGDAKLSIGQHRDAVEDYRLAVKAVEADAVDISDSEKADDIDYGGLFNNLSWLLSTSTDDAIRNGQEALDLALKAAKATEFGQAHILSTLAAAYAETGDFEKAREWAQKAVELGKEQGHEQLEQLEEELKSYQQDKPWREEQTVEENIRPFSAAEPIDT
jgi:tetratricopeptide (TPR) repeat protein